MKSFIKAKVYVKTAAKPVAKTKKASAKDPEKIEKKDLYINADSIAALVRSDKDLFRIIFKDKAAELIEKAIGTTFTDAFAHKDDLK